MARRRIRDLDRRSGVDQPLPADNDPGPWLLPFDRERHERARLLLGADTAAGHTAASTTARLMDIAAREYEQAGLTGENDTWSATPVGPSAVAALRRLADVQERHVTLLTGQRGHDALTLAELAVAHRRQLARHDATHRPLLGLSLVLLTHQLHAAGRIGDAIATGQEAIDLLSRQAGVAPGVDVRPALVLALDASLMTCLANGRRVDALEDLVRATDLLDDICHDHPEFEPDLDEHLRIVAQALSDLRLDDDPGAASAGPAPRRGTTRAQPMPPWPTPEPPDPLGARTRADDLLDDAQHLAASDGDGPAAAAAAGAAVAAYRRMLSEQPAQRWHRTLRRLSRALWRQAIILSELLERPRDAMGPGRESLTLAREIMRSTESADGFDELIGELGVTLYDLDRIAWAAELVGEHDQLAEEASRITVDSVGAQAMRAFGAALHRRAAEACETTAALMARDRPMTAVVAAGLHTSTRAVAIRRALIDDDDDPVLHWELANSLLANGHLRCLDGANQRGAQAMVDAHGVVASLPGHAAKAMRDAARSALRTTCAAHRDITPRSDWPL